jgi:thioredoxin-related protein
MITFKKFLSKALLIVPLFALISCGGNASDDDNTNQETRTYEDYKEFIFDDIDDMYSFDGTYGVYLYSNTCPHCAEIKTNVFNHLDKLKNGDDVLDIKMIDMVGTDSVVSSELKSKFKTKPADYTKDDVPNLINEMKNDKPKSVADTYFFYVPAVYVIEDNTFVNLFAGTSDTVSLLDNN